MKTYKTVLGLPVLGLNCLCIAVGFWIVLVGVRIAKGADLALEVANTKLTATGSIRRLETLSNELAYQAELIRQKDEAYQDLAYTYNRSLKGKLGYEKLQDKIEKVEQIPQPENIENILDEIKSTEQLLLESTNE